MTRRFAVFFFLVICFASCKSGIRDVAGYNAWLNNPSHENIVVRRVGGVAISVKYQPPAYLALKDMEHMEKPERSSVVWDSLIRNQQRFVTFLMTIGPDETVSEAYQGAVMAEGITSYSDYVQRVLATNFSMEQYVKLYIDDLAHGSLLSVVENMYELTQNRSFVVVFPASDKGRLGASDELVFVYEDPFFDIGKIQCSFLKKHMERAENLSVTWESLSN